jgi:hypothetical protein
MARGTFEDRKRKIALAEARTLSDTPAETVDWEGAHLAPLTADELEKFAEAVVSGSDWESTQVQYGEEPEDYAEWVTLGPVEFSDAYDWDGSLSEPWERYRRRVQCLLRVMFAEASEELLDLLVRAVLPRTTEPHDERDLEESAPSTADDPPPSVRLLDVARGIAAPRPGPAAVAVAA